MDDKIILAKHPGFYIVEKWQQGIVQTVEFPYSQEIPDSYIRAMGNALDFAKSLSNSLSLPLEIRVKQAPQTQENAPLRM